MKVVAPRDGSPAAAAEIKPGDVIYTIDKEPTYDLSLPEIEQRLRGPVGSEVALLLRRGTGKPIDVTLKRAAGKFPTVDPGSKAAISAISGSPGSTMRPRRRSPQRSRICAAGRQTS